MLHAKMMMDPVISLVLFNEYIPLKQPAKKPEQAKTEEEEKLCGEMGGLFLGKTEEEPKKEAGGLFIRSEPAAAAISSADGGGLFIRSEASSSSPDCSTDDWVIA